MDTPIDRNAIQHSLPLGGFTVSTLLAGTRTVADDPQKTFGTNVRAEDFATVARDAFLPADRWQSYFTPVLVSTPQGRVLFDTGLSADGLLRALTAAGHTPDDIDTVVLTHMHGDHVNGLMTDDGPTFPNARHVAGRVEFDAWSQMESETFEAKVRPLAERMTFVEGGDAVVQGITALEAFGHTPGHMAFRLDSEGEELLMMVDTANHHVFSLAHPDWEVSFDMDKAAAAATRRRIVGMAAAEKLPVIGYHMPFPATGFVEARGDGFRWVPATDQFRIAAG